MCKICYSDEKALQESTNIDATGCKMLTYVPYLKNLRNLTVKDCSNLGEIDHRNKLVYLDCSRCTKLTRLPKFDNMLFLDCFGCTGLTRQSQMNAANLVIVTKPATSNTVSSSGARQVRHDYGKY